MCVCVQCMFLCVYTYVCVRMCAYARVCAMCITVASLARTTLGVWAVGEEVTPTSTHRQAKQGWKKGDAKKRNKLAAEEKSLGIICSLKTEPGSSC